ncbi:MAG: BrnA antitoxin family protein, partial [Deltaproteobacteria bacterium]|nr:BrnA antitoxin family protein [Deltaproteobacteria bacterium]
DKNIRSYTAAELKAERADSRTVLTQVDATTDEELERLIVGADDEGGHPDWARARLVLPEAKQDVHLRLDQEIITFFKERGKGILSGCKRSLRLTWMPINHFSGLKKILRTAICATMLI